MYTNRVKESVTEDLSVNQLSSLPNSSGLNDNGNTVLNCWPPVRSREEWGRDKRAFIRVGWMWVDQGWPCCLWHTRVGLGSPVQPDFPQGRDSGASWPPWPPRPGPRPVSAPEVPVAFCSGSLPWHISWSSWQLPHPPCLLPPCHAPLACGPAKQDPGDTVF